MKIYDRVSERILGGGPPADRSEACEILRTPDEEVPSLLAASFEVRRKYFQRRVHLHVLVNAKSGICSEDCGYCSQSKISKAPIPRYPLLEGEKIQEGARKARELGACTYCIVASGRGPTDDEVERIGEVVRRIKREIPLHVCLCLGILTESQARRLKEAGVDRYNHNLNTSRRFTPSIVTTHTFEDRLRTIENVRKAGISPCSGAIFGMGETDEDIVDVALDLRRIGAESIPVNFLHPIPGTPLGSRRGPSPLRALKILSLMRLVNPQREIRIAGGRELNLRTLQPLGLYAANSIFVGDYLTTEGQPPWEDYRMIEDLGFEIDPRPPVGG